MNGSLSLREFKMVKQKHTRAHTTSNLKSQCVYPPSTSIRMNPSVDFGLAHRSVFINFTSNKASCAGRLTENSHQKLTASDVSQLTSLQLITSSHTGRGDPDNDRWAGSSTWFQLAIRGHNDNHRRELPDGQWLEWHSHNNWFKGDGHQWVGCHCVSFE